MLASDELVDGQRPKPLNFPLKLTVIVTDPSNPEVIEICVEEKDDFRKIFNNIACQWRITSPILNSKELYSNYYFEYINWQLTPEYIYERDWDTKFSEISRITGCLQMDVIRLHSNLQQSSRQRTIDKLVGIPVRTLVGRPVSREVLHFIHSLQEYCFANLPTFADGISATEQVYREHPLDLLDHYPEELLQASVVFKLWIPFPEAQRPTEIRVKGVLSAFTVQGNATAKEALHKAIVLYNTKTKEHLHPADRVLKVAGRQQYLLGDKPVVAYAWLYECGSPSTLLNLSRREDGSLHQEFTSGEPIIGPVLVLDRWSEIVEESHGSRVYSSPDELKTYRFDSDDMREYTLEAEPTMNFSSLSRLGTPCKQCTQEPTKCPMVSSISLPCIEDYQVTITFQHISAPQHPQVANGPTGGPHLRIKACIYQAERRLCPPVDCEIHQTVDLKFELFISQLPRSARLCMVLLSDEIHKDGKKAKSHTPVSWANLCLFDFEYRLINRRVGVIFWPLQASEFQRDKEHDFFRPLGSVMSNPHPDANCMKLDFMPCKMSSDKIIVYPSFQEMLTLAPQSVTYSGPTAKEERRKGPSEREKTRIKEILHQSPLQKCDVEGNLLWKHRSYVMQIDPDSLPKIVESIDWCNQRQVAQLYVLLKGWPDVDTSVATALELLDCKITDEAVRHFAVIVLSKHLTYRGASLYLPQLVQALKYENYLESYLATFLLSKAIENREFGQMLFYYLRCEMSIPSVSIRFGLLIDAYLRTCPGRMNSLEKQLNAAMCMGRISENLRTWLTEAGASSGGMLATSSRVKDDCLSKMRSELQETTCQHILEHFTSPLHPDIVLKELVVEGCKFFDSKMMPLQLSWKMEDSDAFPAPNAIIYKRGDDLRQDILTLQIFHLMQELWKKAGLPLRLRPYRVIALNSSEGFIEMVPDSCTLSSIFKADKTRECVYNWLVNRSQTKGHEMTRNVSVMTTRGGYGSQLTLNGEGKRLPDIVIERFMQSFAAYTVAGFVLGVGDRHTDNIMISSDGTFFHIDFGNFLGNFKKFAGISREPARFLLVAEFLYVITYADTRPEKEIEFQKLCKQAYLALRKEANLLITMFLLMANTGLPQLSSPENLRYLETSLKLHDDEKKAKEYFRKEWEKSLNMMWRVKADWKVHGWRRP